MPCATDWRPKKKKKVERLCALQRFAINENNPEMNRE